MSYAEYFLLTWAVLSTVLAGYLWGRVKHYFTHGRILANLIAEVVAGEVKPTTRADGFTVLENDEIRFAFRKSEE